jgi:hypothetical protein
MLWMGIRCSGGSLHRAARFGALHDMDRTGRLVALVFPPSLQPTARAVALFFLYAPVQYLTRVEMEDGRPASLYLTVVTAIVVVCADSMLRPTSTSLSPVPGSV